MAEINLAALAQQQNTALSADTSLSDIVSTLTNTQLTSLPIVNEHKQLIGLVSQQDCHKALLMSSYHCDKPVTAIDIMQQSQLTINAHQSVADIAIQALELSQDIYPMVENNQFIGSISQANILSALNDSLSLCS